MTRYSLVLLIAVVLLACCEAAQDVSIVGKLNVAVVSPVKASLTVVKSVDQDPNAISVSLSSGFSFYVNDSFTGVVGIIIVDNSGSSAASGLFPNKGILIPFLLCLLLLVTRGRGFVFGSAILFLVCSLAFAAAAPSEVTVTITVPPIPSLNCLVLAVSDTTGSTADCSAVANLTCQVATTPDVLGQTCACLKKPISSAQITAYSNPATFDSSGGTFSCVYEQTGAILANVTNTDTSPSCLDFVFQFQSQSSIYDFNNVTSVTSNVPSQVQCSFDVDTATCSGILDAGQTADFTVDYRLTSCCNDSPGQLVAASVLPHGKIVPLASIGVNVTITDSCV